MRENGNAAQESRGIFLGMRLKPFASIGYGRMGTYVYGKAKLNDTRECAG